MDNEKKPIKDLGCLNGFRVIPEEMKACQDQHHVLKETNIGRCYNRYTCEICGISYTVDSSD